MSIIERLDTNRLRQFEDILRLLEFLLVALAIVRAFSRQLVRLPFYRGLEPSDLVGIGVPNIAAHCLSHCDLSWEVHQHDMYVWLSVFRVDGEKNDVFRLITVEFGDDSSDFRRLATRPSASTAGIRGVWACSKDVTVPFLENQVNVEYLVKRCHFRVVAIGEDDVIDDVLVACHGR